MAPLIVILKQKKLFTPEICNSKSSDAILGNIQQRMIIPVTISQPLHFQDMIRIKLYEIIKALSRIQLHDQFKSL